MSKTSNKAKFQTKDINLASYLKGVKNYLVAGINQEESMMIFSFYDDDRQQREKDVLDFYNNVGGFLHYTNAWKDLKNMIHNVKKSI